jgi:hypothetical protein
MSQRSIIEINHDYSHVIDENPYTFVNLLKRALGSGSDESWAPLRRYGVTRVTQCHHSEDRRVVVGKDGLKREYEFG